MSSTPRPPVSGAYQSGRWKIVTAPSPGARPSTTASGSCTTWPPTRPRSSDLAAVQPDVVAELAAAWETRGLDATGCSRWTTTARPRPCAGPAMPGFADPVTLLPGTPTPGALPVGPAGRSTATSRSPRRSELAAGDDGVLVAHGDQGGGYLLVIDTDDRGEPNAGSASTRTADVHRTPPIRLGSGESELLVLAASRAAVPAGRAADRRPRRRRADRPAAAASGWPRSPASASGPTRGGPVDWERASAGPQPPVHRRPAHRPLRARTASPARPRPNGPASGPKE